MGTYSKTYVDKSRPFGGWFYDDQQNIFSGSRLMAVSLHANSVPVRVQEEIEYEVRGKMMKKYQGDLLWFHHDNKVLHKDDALMHYPYGNTERDDSAIYNKGVAHEDAEGYFIEPLCTCFTHEDFNISVTNNYQQTGGDTVEQIWNSLKPFAPALKKIRRMGETTYNDAKERAKSGKSGLLTTAATKFTDVADGIANFFGGHEVVSQFMDDLDGYLSKALVLNGARFSYYAGTNLGFNNLGMRFTIFPKWRVDASGKPEFVTVNQQVDELLPYVVGQYTDWAAAAKILKTMDLEGVIGWNTPPGDFRINGSDVDVVQKGTLKLKIGTQYALTNLVVENATFNFSKTMVKNPMAGYEDKGEYSRFGFDNTEKGFNTRSGENLITPLYCEINLQLRPITKYTSKSLERFINGQYNRFDRNIVKAEINKHLEKGNSTMKSKYPTAQGLAYTRSKTEETPKVELPVAKLNINIPATVPGSDLPSINIPESKLITDSDPIIITDEDWNSLGEEEQECFLYDKVEHEFGWDQKK